MVDGATPDEQPVRNCAKSSSYFEVVDLLATDATLVGQLNGSDRMVVIDLVWLQGLGGCSQSFVTAVQRLVVTKALSSTGTQRHDPTVVVSATVELGVGGGLLGLVQFHLGLDGLVGRRPSTGGILDCVQA